MLFVLMISRCVWRSLCGGLAGVREGPCLPLQYHPSSDLRVPCLRVKREAYFLLCFSLLNTSFGLTGTWSLNPVLWEPLLFLGLLVLPPWCSSVWTSDLAYAAFCSARWPTGGQHAVESLAHKTTPSIWAAVKRALCIGGKMCSPFPTTV